MQKLQNVSDGHKRKRLEAKSDSGTKSFDTSSRYFNEPKTTMYTHTHPQVHNNRRYLLSLTSEYCDVIEMT